MSNVVTSKVFLFYSIILYFRVGPQEVVVQEDLECAATSLQSVGGPTART